MSIFRDLHDEQMGAPRLRVGQTLWGLQGLPFNAGRQSGIEEWSIEEKIERVAEAGFEHLECWLERESPETIERALAALARHGLPLALGHRPYSVEQTLATVENARRWGAQYVLCQPASARHSLESVTEIITAGARAASEAGLPYFVETHRNNYTETIEQTLALIEALPEIRLTADFSHFVLVGEFYGWANEGAIELLRPIIERVAHIHGRISNGEQIQVDIGDGAEREAGTPTGFFLELWRQCCAAWRENAQPGQLLPFSVELGPPRYAIVAPDGREISDRWNQSLVIADLAREAAVDAGLSVNGARTGSSRAVR